MRTPRIRTAASTVAALTAATVLMTVTACSNSSRDSAAAPKTVTYNADYPVFDSVDSLFAKANLVIEGRVEPGTRTLVQKPSHVGTDPKLNPGGAAGPDGGNLVSTVYRVTVTHVYKGQAAAGQVVEVKQLGGTDAGVTYTDSGTINLIPGNSPVLFLQTYTDSPASLLNPEQGQYTFTTTGRAAPVGGNQISFTRADLDRLAAGK